MANPNRKAIPCKIYKAVFSGERHFVFELDAGEVYESLAPRYHMWNADKKALGEFEPSGNEPINGYVNARIVGREDNKVVVFLPDSENLVIDESRLVERPVEAEAHVSA